MYYSRSLNKKNVGLANLLMICGALVSLLFFTFSGLVVGYMEHVSQVLGLSLTLGTVMGLGLLGGGGFWRWQLRRERIRNGYGA